MRNFSWKNREEMKNVENFYQPCCMRNVFDCFMENDKSKLPSFVFCYFFNFILNIIVNKISNHRK